MWSGAGTRFLRLCDSRQDRVGRLVFPASSRYNIRLEPSVLHRRFCFVLDTSPMAFQIRPIHVSFLCVPALPAALSRLLSQRSPTIWFGVGITLMRARCFRRLDPVLWKSCNHNPILMLLGRLPQAVLEKSAADARYLAVYKRACERFDAYLATPARHPGQLIAYFSMEYGLLDCMPIYSGGLGVLSGDHMKSSLRTRKAIPLVGVGLLYQARIPHANSESRRLAAGTEPDQRFLNADSTAEQDSRWH